MQSALPPHIANLDPLDIELYLAWVKNGGNPTYSIDKIQDSFITARQSRREVIESCVHDWMNRHNIDWDNRVPIDYVAAFERLGGDYGYCTIVEQGGGCYAFLNFDVNAH